MDEKKSIQNRALVAAKIIPVQLKDIKNKDILTFIFDGENIDVNLNSDTCQVELKKVFSRIVELLIKKNVILKLDIEESYSRVLIKEACTEYIDDVNKEIADVRKRFKDDKFIS